MTDITSVLASSYYSSGLTTPSRTTYKNVDPALYEGSWTGTYSNKKKFSFLVSNVQGFRAQVRYQSEGTVRYEKVLIKDNAFRVGDTKFVLSGNGAASVRSVITNPATNQGSLIVGTARRT